MTSADSSPADASPADPSRAQASSVDDWLAAAITSHVRLAAVVAGLSAEEITGPAYPSEWSVAQVLSHLGSGAEIFGLFLQAGLAGAAPPGVAEFEPIWDRWNARPPAKQAADALLADRDFLDQVEALDDAARRDTRLSLFGMDQTVADLLRYRLGEHTVHTWDVEVTRDPTVALGAPGRRPAHRHVGPDGQPRRPALGSPVSRSGLHDRAGSSVPPGGRRHRGAATGRRHRGRHRGGTPADPGRGAHPTRLRPTRCRAHSGVGRRRRPRCVAGHLPRILTAACRGSSHGPDLRPGR